MFGMFKLSSGEWMGVIVTLIVIAGLYLAAKRASPKLQPLLLWGSALAAIAGTIYWVAAISSNLPKDIDDHVGIAAQYLKAILALTAAACVYYEMRRVEEKRPIAERWKKFVGISLGIAAVALYFNGAKVGYAKFWHRHDQYHYYFGAKYFRELGY